jgi:hypothetical protein
MDALQMNIKRQPFGSAVRTGTWLHLALAAFLLFQLFFPGGSFSVVMGLGLAIDWIVGSLYSRAYVKTWPVQIFNVALGGMFADIFARCAAGLALGIFFFFSNIAASNLSAADSLMNALSVAGLYVVWGAMFGAAGAAYSLLRNKDIINASQSLILFIAIAGLWIAQYTYDTVSVELHPSSFSAMLNWTVAAVTVMVALYVPNKTDGVALREFGQTLVLMLVGFLASLLYSYVPPGELTVLHGFPFGISLEGWQRLTILMNLLFWYNIAFLLISVRAIVFIQSYSRE